MFYKLTQSVQIGRKLFEVNLRRIENKNGLDQFVLADPYVYISYEDFECNPKTRDGKDVTEEMKRELWGQTVKTWLAEGVIEKAEGYRKPDEGPKEPTLFEQLSEMSVGDINAKFKEFGVDVPPNNIRKPERVQTLCNLIEANKE